MNASTANAIFIDAPEFFADPAFVEWLSTPRPKFAFGDGSLPGAASDVFVLVDPSFSGEGSDSDMPEHIWNQIVAECKKHLGHQAALSNHVVVWIRNTGSDADLFAEEPDESTDTSAVPATEKDLAKEFSRILREFLTVSQMNLVLERNKAQTDPSICHSHDFCDANMAMLEAAENLKITSIVRAGYGELPESVEEEGRVFWSRAWDIARSADFLF